MVAGTGSVLLCLCGKLLNHTSASRVRSDQVCSGGAGVSEAPPAAEANYVLHKMPDHVSECVDALTRSTLTSSL